MSKIPVVKNDEEELPIPHVWRPILKDIVRAFVAQDYSLSSGIDGVRSVSEETASQIRDYIDDYGEKLVMLPDTSWESSVYLWHGSFWLVLVDLWTEGEGRSDLVLRACVREKKDLYDVEVKLVYVP